MFGDSDNVSTTYFIKNTVDDLKIRITIEKLGTLFNNYNLPTIDPRPMSSGFNSSRTQTSSLGSGYDDTSANINFNVGYVSGQTKNQIIEKTSFSWGQLLENNFKNINELNESNDNDKLSTSEDGDNPDVKSRVFTIIPNTQTSSEMVISKNDKSLFVRNRKVKPMNLITKKTPIIDNPTIKQKLDGRHVNENEEKMIIKVYLGSNDKLGKNYDNSQEFVIAYLTLINGKILIIDGKVKGEGIKIQGKDGIYRICLEIIDNIIFNNISFDNESFSNLMLEDHDNVKDSDYNIKISYLLTIQKTKNFPYDGVYIEYVIELPDNMKLFRNDEFVLFGRTHVCNNNWEGISYFSFPIEINCLLELKKKFTTFPVIYFKICSEDEYNSFYINGYTSLYLPLKSGTEFHKLPSWCPIDNNSYYNQLYNLFLGQSSDINDITKQFIKEGSCSSSIGISTESRGDLYLSISTIMQSKHLILNDEMSSLKYSVMNKGFITDMSLYMKIKKVLLDFEKARNKLLLLKDK
uniref:Arrestin_N domain-containing protein n=1 Tax=Parastrongyloides trichosuri TaxID=131310 RepID=A0A0N4ZVA1_PARTI